jgi:hypothetical protein
MQAIETGRQEYRIPAWLRTLHLLLGLMLIGFGVFIANLLVQQKNYGLAVFMAILPMLPACFILAMALRSRLVIDGTRFEVHYAFTEKAADLSEVEGYRTISSRNGSFWRLQLKDGRGAISIYKWFDNAQVRAWLAQIPNLDELDRKAMLAEIEQNQDLGATPQERLARLAGAKRVNIGLTVVAVLVALAFAFGSASLRYPSAVVLAVIPAGLIYLIHQAPLLYGLFTPKRDPRTNFGIAFLVCGVGLIIGNHGVHFVETPRMLEYAGLVALLCCAGIYSAAQKNSQFWGVVLGMLLLACPYGWGVAAAADTLPDKSAPANYTATVVNKHLTSGRSTTYYLDLSPWGPMQGKNDVSVPRSTYQNAAIGDQVCLALHSGALHVQWYQLVACENSGQ